MPFGSARDLVATIVGVGDSVLLSNFVTDVVTRTEVDNAAWVIEGRVADVFAADMGVAELRARLQDYLQERPVDILIQPVATRRKKLLVADMESTIIEQEMLDELAKVIGVGDRVAEITRRAMNGELDFAAALRERVSLLKGQPVALLDQVAKHISLMPGAKALLTAMRNQKAECWLVSGGFTCFAKPVAEKLGFTRVFANELLVKDGVITGEVAEPILDKNSKQNLLEQACRELNINMAESLAIGDGANDVPMLAACNAGHGLGVAYHAKPKVREVIPNQINQSDLSALVYAQGLV